MGRYREGRRKRRASKRAIEVKVRIITREPMTREEAWRRLERSIVTGIVQPGIEIAFVDWARATEHPGIQAAWHVEEGQYLDQDAVDALVNFRHLLLSPNVRRRFEPVIEE